MNIPRAKDETPEALTAAFILRGRMIHTLAHKVALNDRRARRLRDENARLKQKLKARR